LDGPRAKESTVTATHFDSYTQARTHFKDLLNAAEAGLPATVRRDETLAAVVDADRLRNFLMSALPSSAQIVAENAGSYAFMPGLPVSADGATPDEAVDELGDALREYVSDWEDHLRVAPNHRGNWALVQLVRLCDDDQLRRWLVGTSQ
jgi:predicted RNase H-like HicB family nuclease